MLALLPIERVDTAAVQPRVDGGAELWGTPHAERKRHPGQLAAEPAAQLPQRPELVQLPEPVETVPGLGPPRLAEAPGLPGPPAPRRPPRAGGGRRRAPRAP